MNRRMIDCSMWHNEHFAELPMGARLLQIGMINHADDQGRLKANPTLLKSQIFPYDDMGADEVQGWLDMMVANETIILYIVNGKQYAQLVNWWKYQSLQYAQPSQYPRPTGWSDRIRKTITKGFIATCNWYTVEGAKLNDTCDMDGNPLTGNNSGPNRPSPQKPPTPPAPLNVVTPVYVNGDSPTKSAIHSPEPTPDYSGESLGEHSPEGTIELNINKLNITSSYAHACEVEPEPPLAAALPDVEKRKAFVKAFEHSWAMLLTPYTAEKLDDWVGRVPIEAWEFALHECAESRKTGNWKYLESILRRVEAEGVPKVPLPVPKAQAVNGQVSINFLTV